MSEKHTPGKLMGEVNINDLGAKQIRYSLGIGTTILFHTSFENSRPNANRMMKCWNSHDALLEACKAAKTQLTGVIIPMGAARPGTALNKVIVQIEAAISQAEKEGEIE